MRNKKIIIKQLKGIKAIAQKRCATNPEYYSILIKCVDETLNEIYLEQLAEIEALDMSFETEFA